MAVHAGVASRGETRDTRAQGTQRGAATIGRNRSAMFGHAARLQHLHHRRDHTVPGVIVDGAHDCDYEVGVCGEELGGPLCAFIAVLATGGLT